VARLALFVGALVALAGCQSTPNYKATEAASHAGETATVTGTWMEFGDWALQQPKAVLFGTHGFHITHIPIL